MLDLLAAALVLLSSLFVPGAELLGPNARNVSQQSSIVRDGRQYAGYAEWWYDSSGNYREQIVIDTSQYPSEYLACLLVHEAAHLTFKDDSTRGLEEVPYLYEYVCLDRLGAPQWLKDDRYRQMSQRRNYEDSR